MRNGTAAVPLPPVEDGLSVTRRTFSLPAPRAKRTVTDCPGTYGDSVTRTRQLAPARTARPEPTRSARSASFPVTGAGTGTGAAAGGGTGAGEGGGAGTVGAWAATVAGHPNAASRTRAATGRIGRDPSAPVRPTLHFPAECPHTSDSPRPMGTRHDPRQRASPGGGAGPTRRIASANSAIVPSEPPSSTATSQSQPSRVPENAMQLLIACRTMHGYSEPVLT